MGQPLEALLSTQDYERWVKHGNEDEEDEEQQHESEEAEPVQGHRANPHTLISSEHALVRSTGKVLCYMAFIIGTGRCPMEFRHREKGIGENCWDTCLSAKGCALVSCM